MRTRRLAISIFVCALSISVARDASAQLLSSLLQQVLPANNNGACALLLLSSSPNGGDSLLWSQHIVWGTSLVGTSYDTGDHIVWGTAELSDSTVWADLGNTPDDAATP